MCRVGSRKSEETLRDFNASCIMQHEVAYASLSRTSVGYNGVADSGCHAGSRPAALYLPLSGWQHQGMVRESPCEEFKLLLRRCLLLGSAKRLQCPPSLPFGVWPLIRW